MALTFEQFKDLRDKGLSIDQITRFEGGEKPASIITEEPPQDFFSRVSQDISQRGEAVTEEITKPQSPIVGGLKATAQIFGGIGDVVKEGIKSIPLVGKLFGKAEEVAQKGVSKVIDYSSPIGQKLFEFEQKYPKQARYVTDFLEAASASGDIAGNILLAEGIRAGAVKTGELAQKGAKEAGELSKTLLTRSEKSIESSVTRKFEKGVKPLLPTKTSPTKLADYRQDVVEAVKTIRDNKQNLNFADDIEGFISGQNPKSLQQLSEALEQTKKTIFNQYDNLAKTAGEAGAQINTTAIASELDKVISNKALSITDPSTIKYAQGWQERLNSVKTLDTTTGQEVVKNLNESLSAFYKNPSYETASRAAIDAMIANRLRKVLDDTITGLTGTQYQALKNQYGSLKAIERDVIKAALRDARKNIKGLLDYTDIFSGSEVVSGILSLNPAQIASGVVKKGIAEYYKFLTNPNRAIEKMFTLSEKLP